MVTVVVALLRGVNVGGHKKVPMADLRVMAEAMGFTRVRTYVQSGNLVFATKAKADAKLTARIEQAIEERFGFPVDVVLRTAEELRAVSQRNPFVNRPGGWEPSKLLVSFLREDPGAQAREAVAALNGGPEELRLEPGRELFIYYPNGAGKSKLAASKLDRALAGVTGTARNWNSVLALLEMAEAP